MIVWLPLFASLTSVYLAKEDVVDSIRVALIQMKVVDGEKEKNVSHALELIDKADEQGAKLVILPETADIGWIYPGAARLAEPIPGPTTRRFSEKARNLGIFIVATITERDGPDVFDSAILIDDSGRLILKHRKINILQWEKPRYSGNRYYWPGAIEDLRVAQTKYGTIGLTICADSFYDRVNLTKRLSEMGAWLVISPGGWVPPPPDTRPVDTQKEWEKLLSGRAKEAGVYLLGVNAAECAISGPDWTGCPYVGHSLAVAPDGRLMAVGADLKEDIVLVDLPLPDGAR